MTSLLIVESPAKAKTIKQWLGPGWEVSATKGHIRDLPKNDLGIQPQSYTLKYVPVQREGRDVYAELRKAISGATDIYIGTDSDREGEAIAWHVVDEFQISNYKRVPLGDISERAIKAAIQAPRTLDMNLVHAQEARRALDRLVGYKVSPILWDAGGEDDYSAGRTQSIAVLLIVQREREIAAFKVTKHFGAKLSFKDGWTAEWQTKPDFTTDDAPYFMDRAFAQAVANVKDVTTEDYKESETRRSPPGAFITLTMQQAASTALGFNAKKTMELAQKLKDAGHISYHRTDNPNIPVDAMPALRAVAEEMGLDVVETQRKFPIDDDAQEAHPGIVPLHWEVEAAGDTADEIALYKLVRLRAIASQLADARFAVRTAMLRATNDVEGKRVTFKASGRKLVYPGWMALIAGDQAEDEEDDTDDDARNPVPSLVVSENVSPLNGKLLEKKTNAPKRYSEPSLLKKLKAEGIGRPSTFDSIIAVIVKRDYADLKKKKFYPTARGELVYDTLMGRFEFMDVSYTRSMEKTLDAVAAGKATYLPIVSELDARLTHELSVLPSLAKYACPVCGKPLRLRPGKFGKFWGCSGYPACNHKAANVDGKPGEAKSSGAATTTVNVACTQCGKPMRRIPKKPGHFWGCTGYPECKHTLPDDDGRPGAPKAKAPAPVPAPDDAGPVHACPTCKKALRRKQGSKGDKPYDFYGCTGWPTCTTNLRTGPDGNPVYPTAQ